MKLIKTKIKSIKLIQVWIELMNLVKIIIIILISWDKYKDLNLNYWINK